MPDESRAPERALPYEKLDLIGLGATSEVFRAADAALKRTVALKEQRPDATPEQVAAFVEEARATARLEHPNIVPVYALGPTDSGRMSIAMQELRGESLTQIVEQATNWPSRAYFVRVVSMLVRVADALRFAHDLGYLHRDVKPDNILVGGHGETYLLDWGLARHPRSADGAPPQNADATADGTITGTPRFMSPEQADGDSASVDVRTDVFGLGATLYFAVTRSAPYTAHDVLDALDAARRCRFADPSTVHPEVALPTDLCAVVRRAMSACSDDRYPDIASMAADLEHYLHVGDRVTLRRFAPGEVIVAEGDEAHEAFRILSGTCAVTRRVRGQDVPVRTMAQGEPFGETAIFGGSTRSATVTAQSEVMLEVMSRTDVEAWLDGDAWIAPFVRTLAGRFIGTEKAADKAEHEARAWRAATHILVATRWDPGQSWSSMRAAVAAALDVDVGVVDEGLARAGLTVADDRVVDLTPS